jgi:hypothetical protein
MAKIFDYLDIKNKDLKESAYERLSKLIPPTVAAPQQQIETDSTYHVPEIPLVLSPNFIKKTINDKLTTPSNNKDTNETTTPKVIVAPSLVPKLTTPTALEQQEQVKTTEPSDMDKALDLQSQTNALTLIGKIGSQLGSAIAGVKADTSGYDDINKAAAQGVQNVITKNKFDLDMLQAADDKEKNDVNSSVSQVTRDLAKRMYKDLNMSLPANVDKLTAASIEKGILPILDKYAERNLRNKQLEENYKLAQLGKEEKQNDKQEYRIQDWLTNQLDKEMKSEEVKRLIRLNNDAKNLAQAMANPGGIRDITSLYSFLKSIDDNTGVKEGEVKLGLEAMTALQRLKTLTSDFSDRKRVLDNAMLKDIESINRSATESAQAAYNKRMEAVFNIGKDRGISEDRLKRSLGRYLLDDKKNAQPSKGKKYKVGADGNTLEEIK